MAKIQRHKISTFASGMDAVLHIHEIVGKAGAGPTVGISAAIHGNEGTGSQVILDLARRIDPAKVKGRILLLPVANPPAFFADELRAPLARAIYRPAFTPRAELAPWRQWGEGLEAEAVKQMANACALPVAVAGALRSGGDDGHSAIAQLGG